MRRSISSGIKSSHREDELADQPDAKNFGGGNSHASPEFRAAASRCLAQNCP